MYFRISLFFFVVFFGVISFAQSQNVKLSGKILNAKNEALPGVSVKIVGAQGGTTTDVEGRFSLNLSVGKKYELEFSAIGYAKKTINDVEVATGQVNELNIVLDVAVKSGENVIVTSNRISARRETVSSILSFQKNTNTVASVISAESIRRSPDRNTGEVLKRTPGASIQEGRFIVIRGLADRYNQAMLNGILLTSTEPDRKTFSFDLIPAPMIDNIVINKAFVPEYPGEWAGGLIQVNTRDIPAKGFFNIQIGTGINTQTTRKKFFREAQGGKTDWLGIEDGTRELPESYPTKSGFDTLSYPQKIAIGKELRNSWLPLQNTAKPDVSFQLNGGFNTKVFGKTLGGTLGIVYNKRDRYIDQENISNALSSGTFTQNYDYKDAKYIEDISWGALGSLTLQINPLHKISIKSIFNINTPNSVTQRTGEDFTRNEQIKGTETTFKENIFYNGQISGEHKIAKPLALKWYGSFNILSGYIPDQRRLAYSRASNTSDPYRAIISGTLSQQSGSRIYQNLSDYIYTAGGDLSYNFNWLGQKQTIKGGYMLQIRDRLYDALLFANYLQRDNDALRQQPADQIFSPANFGDGSANSTLFSFDAIKGSNFRYMANTILNGGFLQFDNQFSKVIRAVWGLRVEDYDQLVGSVKSWDPRHTHRQVRDYLPGVNITFKINNKTNIRVSGSQTVTRPELRELAFTNLYDFELNASVQGLPTLLRSKVTNTDLRYELYSRPGEVFTVGVFYKDFDDPIEAVYNEGSGGASSFNFQNADKATAYGAELEFRKKLDFSNALKNFTFQANLSYIHSEVTATNLKIDRPLQGQSPYVINVGLMYDLEKAGFNATVLFNQIGERIYLAGDVRAVGGSPDIYEAPRPLLDLQLSKKLIKNRAEIKLNISDLLDERQYFYQNADGKQSLQKGKDAYRFTRKFGTTFGITFNYSFVKP